MATHIDVMANGAFGDAIVATDCSMSAFQTLLTSASVRFQATDVGKVIVVYGAGSQAWPGYPQPLTSVILQFMDSQNVVLQDAATTSIASPRVVYGHDDTQAIQKALDQLTVPDGIGGNVGGVLVIPEGHYLTRGLIMDGAQTGTVVVGQGTTEVLMSYNNIWLQGAGVGVSILENWDVAVPNNPYGGAGSPLFFAVIAMNLIADPAPQNRRLSNIVISGLTIRQVLNATESVHAISDTYSEYVQVRDCEIISGSYEGVIMADPSLRWQVLRCDLHDCGGGGPAWGNFLSALDLCGSDWVAEGNEVRNSGQAIEMANHGNRIVNNRFYAPPDGGFAGINTLSADTGVWDNEFTGNLFVGWNSPLQMGNGNGVACRFVIQKNHFINCGWVQIASGLKTNDVQAVATDVHGVTVIRDNIVVRTVPNQTLHAFRVGGLNGLPQGLGGLESVIIEGNKVFDASSKPAGFVALTGNYGGGAYWVTGPATYDPTVAYNIGDYVVPSDITIKFRYVCLTSGLGPTIEPQWPELIGGVTADHNWDCIGVRPYSEGDLVVPSIYNGCYYQCIQDGVPGAVEPAWQITPGDPGVTYDGTVQWVCKKRPFVSLQNNSLTAMSGATSNQQDVRMDDEPTHEVVPLPITPDNLWGSYQLTYFDWYGNGPLHLIPDCGGG